MRKSKNRYFYHIFVSPGDASGPWGNHAKCCMDVKKIRCLQIVSQHVVVVVVVVVVVYLYSASRSASNALIVP